MTIKPIPVNQFMPNPMEVSEQSRAMNLRLEDHSIKALAEGEAQHVDVTTINENLGNNLDVYG